MKETRYWDKINVAYALLSREPSDYFHIKFTFTHSLLVIDTKIASSDVKEKVL